MKDWLKMKKQESVQMVCPECEAEVSNDAHLCYECGVEFEPEGGKETPNPKDTKISFKLLFLGVLFCTLATIGVIGLRLGFLQEFFFGLSDPKPGLGPAEVGAIFVMVIPYVLGLSMIFLWGIRYNDLYHEKKKLETMATEKMEEKAVDADSLVLSTAFKEGSYDSLRDLEADLDTLFAQEFEELANL